MNKINLKCGGHIFVEPFDDHEEEDRCKIYDEYDNYISEIYVNYEELFAKAHYDAVVQEMANCEDFINWISCVFSSCTWGTSLKDLIESVADDKAVEYTYEELQAELKEMYDYLEKHGEREFCTYYLINKVGDYYVCGE